MWQTIFILVAFALFGKIMYNLGKELVEANDAKDELDDLRRADAIIDDYGKLFDELHKNDSK